MAILLIVLVAEFGLRWFIGQQLRDSFNQQAEESGVTVEEEPTISFGPTPLVFSILGGSINEVNVTTPSTLEITYPGGDSALPEITGQPAAVIDIDDLSISDPDNPVAGTLTTTTEVPEEFLLAIIQRQMAEQQGDASGAAGFLQELVTITDITANVEESALDVEFTGGAAVLTLQPVPVDGQLTFEATNASLFGFDLPAQVADGITQALQDGVSEQVGQLGVEQFEVIDGGVRIRVVGENVNLNNLTGQGGQIPAS
ncbi:hypothetical protein A605_01940 [Corynebacterium halotolerans YIM 70093 = DSM 44683]|uniref:Uncharacterized protein n=1 Tax=Corynebacterium halotolerans YIM 70093 = DSM 44683 TaxID=1121362 RepID=M1NPG0_9CORY|nr:hypothetical protein A605_01940 [Corynebacterium halotolerans YIM 70093 = DSM 44683]